MISSFSKVRSPHKTSTNIKPGAYKSEIKKAGWADGYVKGSALKVEYELVDTQGKSFSYTEIFFWNESNERSVLFDEYLKENGIKSFEGMVGFKEEVEILKVVKNNHAALSIVKRQPAKPKDVTSDGNQD